MFSTVEAIRARMKTRGDAPAEPVPAEESAVQKLVSEPAPAPAAKPAPAPVTAPARKKPAPPERSILDRVRSIWARAKGDPVQAESPTEPAAEPAPVQEVVSEPAPAPAAEPAPAPVTAPAPEKPAPPERSILDRIKNIWARAKGEPVQAKPAPEPERAPEPKPVPTPVPELAAKPKVVPPPAPVPPTQKETGIVDRIRDIWNRFKGERTSAAPEVRKAAPPATPDLKNAAPPAPPVERASLPPAASGEPKVLVNRIKFSGNSVFDGNDLNALLAGYLHRELTLPQLKAVAARVAGHYHDNGYFLAQVVIPTHVPQIY